MPLIAIDIMNESIACSPLRARQAPSAEQRPAQADAQAGLSLAEWRHGHMERCRWVLKRLKETLGSDYRRPRPVAEPSSAAEGGEAELESAFNVISVPGPGGIKLTWTQAVNSIACYFSPESVCALISPISHFVILF